MRAKKETTCKLAWLLLLLCAGQPVVWGQSIHFSQYYNAPMLVNPANTALMPDYDYRAGANFRNQWAGIPVPYNTFSAFADFKVAGGNKEISKGWLGLGLAFFDDKAGDGNLSLNRSEGFAAYHLKIGERSMLSAGLSGGYVQRSVNYDNLTFDAQWDGFSFNKLMSNREKAGIVKTIYSTVGAGVNAAFFPNENVYINVGGSVANINQPNESFYNQTNPVGMRTSGNIDALFQVNKAWIFNPSVYYTTQQGAYELLFGTLLRIYLAGHDKSSTQIIFGAYSRLNESIIGAVGFQWGSVQIMVSYDATVSSIAPYTAGSGAMEFSIIYQGVYNGMGGGHATAAYNCPRFF